VCSFRFAGSVIRELKESSHTVSGMIKCMHGTGKISADLKKKQVLASEG